MRSLIIFLALIVCLAAGFYFAMRGFAVSVIDGDVLAAAQMSGGSPKWSDAQIEQAYKQVLAHTEGPFGDKTLRRGALGAYAKFLRDKGRVSEAQPYEDQLGKL